MSGASIIFRAHVPGCDLNRFLDREPVAVRTCARLRWRAHSDLTNAQTPPVTHRVAVLPNSGNVVASILPAGETRGRSVERFRNLAAPLRPTFSRYNAGTCVRDLQIFAGSQVLTAGKCCFSFLRSLVQYPQKSDGGLFHRLVIPPVGFLSLLDAHVSNVSKDSCHERQVTCKG